MLESNPDALRLRLDEAEPEIKQGLRDVLEAWKLSFGDTTCIVVARMGTGFINTATPLAGERRRRPRTH
jgi:hypothetical protein